MSATLPTPAELVTVGQAALAVGLDREGTGAIDIRPGSRHDLFISVAVALATRNATHIADRAAARSPREAKGDDLDVVGLDIYNNPRKNSSPAVTTVYLRRTTTSGATYIPQGSRFTAPSSGTQPDVVFSGDGDIPVDAGAAKVAVPVTCAQNGIVGNIPLANITAITDPLPDGNDWVLYVPTFGDSVLNSGDVDTVGGGDDGEIGNDLAYATRLLKSAFDAATSPGLYQGIVASVLKVNGIFDATVIEPGNGTIVVFCGDVNYQLPSALRTAVLTALPKSRCFGVPAFVLPYTVVKVTVRGRIYMNRTLDNYDTKSIAQRGVSNVADYFKTGRASPDSYFLSAISSAYETADPDVQSVVLDTPGADVKPLAPSAYASATTINRYIADQTTISAVVLEPQTG